MSKKKKLIPIDEEHPDWIKILQEACKNAGEKARAEAFALGLDVMVINDGPEGYGLYFDHPPKGETSTLHRLLPKKSKSKKLKLD